MKAIAIKFKNYAGGVDIVDNSNLHARILHCLFMSMGILSLVYIFLLGSMVWNIVERRSLEAEARTLSNEVGDLELSYLSMSNKVDLNLSTALGFKETKIIFATRKSSRPIGKITSLENDL